MEALEVVQGAPWEPIICAGLEGLDQDRVNYAAQLVSLVLPIRLPNDFLTLLTSSTVGTRRRNSVICQCLSGSALSPCGSSHTLKVFIR